MKKESSYSDQESLHSAEISGKTSSFSSSSLTLTSGMKIGIILTLLSCAALAIGLKFGLSSQSNSNSSNKPKIDHIVVLMLENRAYDHIFGWSNDLKANGLKGNECNYLNQSNYSMGQLCVTRNMTNINTCNPGEILFRFSLFRFRFDCLPDFSYFSYLLL
jgi:phospholipase C